MEHPVFGPERPAAAVRAIAALAAAQEDADRCWWNVSAAADRRLRLAREARDMYPEYADDFRGH